MSYLSAFKNRQFLLNEYTPARLPHREHELEQLKNYFKPVLNENVNVKLHIYGSIGTGKTALCKLLGQHLEKETEKTDKKLKYVHINLAYTPKPYHIMTKLIDQISFIESPRSGLSPEEMLAIVIRNLSKDNCHLVLVLDEVDTYVEENRDLSIFYMLSRVHELDPKATCRLSLIYISRSLEWIARLKKATLDTLGRVLAIQLNKYSLLEVKDILAYRAEEAFESGAVFEDTIDFVTRISVKYGGIRYALELLLEAGNQAEIDHTKKVKTKHARKANRLIPIGVKGAYGLDEHSPHKQRLP